VRDVLNLSTSDNLVTPSSWILFPVLHENEMKQRVVLSRLIAVRDEFDLSTSDNLTAPSVPI
jgi:hypothetical protein